MSRRLIPLLAACLALLPVLRFAPPASSQQLELQTVEVSAALGFNPTVCRMNREYVRFHNVGSTTISIGRPGVIAGDPPFDVQVIPPGGYSIEFSIPYGGNTKFINIDNPSQNMTVVTPVFVSRWEPICTPDPNYQPPQPPCRNNEHCLRVPVVAVD
jgi:hypothetical protein